MTQTVTEAPPETTDETAETITVTMTETAHYSETFPVADLAQRFNVEPTRAAVLAVMEEDGTPDYTDYGNTAGDTTLLDSMIGTGFDHSTGREWSTD